MAIKIQDIEDVIDENGLKVLAYANSGAGKTRSLATINMPTIILSAEAGLLSLKKAIKDNPELKKLLRIIKITCLNDLREALEMFQESEVRLCNWIALDSISEIAEQILKTEKELNVDKRQAYGALAETTLDLLRQFRDLPFYNVYMLAKMVRGEDADGRNFFMPMFPGKGISNNIPYMFDEVFVLHNEEEEVDGEITVKRFFQTNMDSRYIAKDRSGELNMFEKVDLARIYKKIRGVAEVSYELDDETAERYAATIKQIKLNEQGGDEVEGEDEAITSDQETYWYHIKKQKFMSVDAGDDLTALVDQQEEGIVKQVSPAEFENKELASDVEELDETDSPDEEEKDDADEVVIAETVRYWSHDPSDQVMRTEIGEDVTALLNDDDVIEISLKNFLKLGGVDEPVSDDEAAEGNSADGERIIAEEVQYWNSDSKGVFKVAIGDDITDFVNDENEYEQINKKMFDRLFEQQNANEEEVEEEDDEPEILGKKIQYWKHNGSGNYATTEKGAVINGYLNNDEVEEVTKAEYLESQEEQEPEPELEVKRRPEGGLTRVQRAKKEQEDALKAKK